MLTTSTVSLQLLTNKKFSYRLETGR